MDTFEYALSTTLEVALIYGYEDEDVFSGEFDMSDVEIREQSELKDDDNSTSFSISIGSYLNSWIKIIE